MMQEADNGNVEAMIEAANHILWNMKPAEVTTGLIQKAKDYLNHAVEQGHPEAYLTVGAMFYGGRHCEQDFAKAVHWYKKAAKAGSITAISNLGYCYYYGRSVEKNMEMAFQMFAKAALFNDFAALYKLGDMYFKGIYVEADSHTAKFLYQLCYELQLDSKPIDTFPDICLRIAKLILLENPDAVARKTVKNMLKEAIQGFTTRIQNGDKFSHKLLQEAKQELENLER